MKTYSPPARGIIAASSAYVSAPARLRNPAATHATITIHGDSTLHIITRVFRKMPVPMTLPTTTETDAKRPRPRTSVNLSAGSFDIRIAAARPEPFSGAPAPAYVPDVAPGERLRGLLARDDRALHEALPVREVLAREEDVHVRLLQDGPELEPLARPVERVRAVRVGVALPGIGLDVARERGRALVEGREVARDDVRAAALALRRQHVGLLADGVAAQDAAFARLALRAVEVVVRGHVADDGEVLCAPEALVEEDGVLDDARVLQLLGGLSVRGGQGRGEDDLFEGARRPGADARAGL